MDRTQLINFPLSTGKYCSFTKYIIELTFKKKSFVICVANVHMFIEAYKDINFLSIIRDADLITPDGLPLIWALNLLYGINQERVAGMDLLPDLLGEMSDQNISAFFYGGTPEMLDATTRHLKSNYPKLKIAGVYSPPFSLLQLSDDTEIINEINNSTPSIVFVVLGCPKQEKWMASMKDRVNTVMIGIGGALPVMLGLQKRAPRWMQTIGLEWFFRLAQEPKRLFKRYLNTNSLFLWIFTKELIKTKILAAVKLPKKIN